MKIIYPLLFFFCFTAAKAQDIKSLDFSSRFGKNKVRSRDCYEIKYQGNEATDSIHIGLEEFNEQGKITKFTEFFARGKKMAEYSYEYDENGKMIRNTISMVFNDWNPIELKLNFDEKGRIISREFPEAMRSFWTKETFSYNTDGALTRKEQWYDEVGTLRLFSTKYYEEPLIRNDRSLNFIYDHKGLLILHQNFMNGEIISAYNYIYLQH